MLFSSATILSFSDTLPEHFDELLANEAFEPCSSFSQSTFGWVSPLPDGFTDLTRQFGNRVLFCGKREEKVIPTSALQELISEKSSQWTNLEGQKPSSKQRLQFKEAALSELLPRALSKHRRILGYIDPAAGLLVINSASATDVDTFLNYLRMTLGTLAVTRIESKQSAGQLFTQWLKRNQPPPGFELGNACDLFDPEDGSSITCRKVALQSKEILAHIDIGKLCSKLRLTWDQSLSFTLDKDLVLSQIKYEALTEQADDLDGLEPEIAALAELDAQFALLSQELAQLYPKLISVFK